MIDAKNVSTSLTGHVGLVTSMLKFFSQNQVNMVSNNGNIIPVFKKKNSGIKEFALLNQMRIKDSSIGNFVQEQFKPNSSFVLYYNSLSLYEQSAIDLYLRVEANPDIVNFFLYNYIDGNSNPSESSLALEKALLEGSFLSPNSLDKL